MFNLASFLYLFLSLRCFVAGTVLSRWNDGKGFVTVQNTKFVLDGRQARSTLNEALGN
jgi:hypothetical protein